VLPRTGAGVRLCLSGPEASASSRQANGYYLLVSVVLPGFFGRTVFSIVLVLVAVPLVETSKPVGWKRMLRSGEAQADACASAREEGNQAFGSYFEMVAVTRTPHRMKALIAKGMYWQKRTLAQASACAFPSQASACS
jgi:hypothetical protein